MFPVRYTLEEVWEELFRFFRAHGYLRRPRTDLWPDRSWGEQDWGVRFLLDSTAQLQELQALLRQAGYFSSPPFRKHGKHVLPLSGRHSVELIEELWDHFAPRRHRRE